MKKTEVNAMSHQHPETSRKASTRPELTCHGQVCLFVFDKGILEDLRELSSQIAERFGKKIDDHDHNMESIES